MNEKTCTLEKEMRQALLKKLEQNYLDYTALLQALTPEQLMEIRYNKLRKLKKAK